MTDARELIRIKRDGGELSAAQMAELVAGVSDGSIADYQASAWLMAAVLNSLTKSETVAMTRALVASGRQLDLSPVGRMVLDKHSTGGVGDKVTLVLAPLVAACGAPFGKMSGRALAHTGGTLDKLEAIPGYRSSLSPAAFISQLRDVGVCVIDQSPELAPADDRFYKLRDVTATVESTALIAASIMSKKIAAGARALALDIKVGRGSFFSNRGQASGAARRMKEIGEAHGLAVGYLMTAMDQPLGRTAGNALEVREAVEALRGKGAADLMQVVLALAALLLSLSDLGWGAERCRFEAEAALADGRALARMRQWMDAQGADSGFIDEPDRLPQAAVVEPVPAAATGYVISLDARLAGEAVAHLGAGRKRAGEAVDHSVGIVFDRKQGDRVSAGEPLAHVHAASRQPAQRAVERIQQAYELGSEPPRPAPAIIAAE